MKLNQLDSVLITQGQLKYYAGSEIVALELAEFFISRSARVTILTDYIEEPIKHEFDKLPGLTIFTTDSKEGASLSVDDFDLIWVHHQLLPTPLVRQLATSKNRPYVIFHHMSAWVPVEFPVMHEFEDVLADLVAYNSEETNNILNSQGVKFDNELIFGNPAPDNFFANRKARGGKKDSRLEKLVIVSNHAPEEVQEAAKILIKQGVKVDILGRQSGSTQMRVTPDMLTKYDAVITIGKTVQYSILSNVPVYCYDWFGGPGYLDIDNFQTSKYYNFSGRGFSKKTAQDISEELIDRYPYAATQHEQLHKKYSKDYMLSAALERALQNLHKISLRKVEIKDSVVNASERYQLICKELRKLEKIQSELNLSIAQRDEKIDSLKQHEDKLIARVKYLEQQIDNNNHKKLNYVNKLRLGRKK